MRGRAPRARHPRPPVRRADDAWLKSLSTIFFKKIASMEAFGAYSDSEEDAGEESEAPKPLALQVRKARVSVQSGSRECSARYVPCDGGRLLA